MSEGSGNLRLQNPQLRSHRHFPSSSLSPYPVSELSFVCFFRTSVLASPHRGHCLYDVEFSLSRSGSLATTAPLHQGFSRFGLSFLFEISKIHFPQMGRSLASAAACAPHSGLAALIPSLTAHHISLMVSLMIQLLFLKSRPSALHPPPRRGPRPWDPQSAGGDALRSRRGLQGGGT